MRLGFLILYPYLILITQMKKTFYIVSAALYLAVGVLGYQLGKHSTATPVPAATAAQPELTAHSPLKIYPNDFLVPLNRMCVAGGDFISDTWNAEGSYGSGGSPRIAFLFFIEDALESKRHYFICGGTNGHKISELKYLGANIRVLGREDSTGCMGVKFKKDGVDGEIVSSVMDYGLCDKGPDKNCDSVNYIPLSHDMYDPKYTVDEKRDMSWIYGLTMKEFCKKLQDAIVARDKKTVASMIQFPIEASLADGSGEGFRVTLRSEQEFIDKYDLIITEEDRQNIKNDDPTDVFYSWRGAMFGGFWMTECLCEEGGPLPIDLIYLSNPDGSQNDFKRRIASDPE